MHLGISTSLITYKFTLLSLFAEKVQKDKMSKETNIFLPPAKNKGTL